MTTSATSPPPKSEEDRLNEAIVRSGQQVKRKRRIRSWVVNLVRLGIIVVFLGAWEYGAVSGALRPIFFSSPSAIAEFLTDPEKLIILGEHAADTLLATFWGLVIGCMAGAITGLLLARLPTLDRILQPFITVLNSLPRIALAPLFILWFGLTMNAKVFLAVSLVYFVMLITTRSSALNVDGDLATVVRLLGGNPWQRLIKLDIPAALPGILAGVRLGMVYSLLGVVASEMIAAKSGLGTLIVRFGQNLEPEGMFGTLAIFALVAWLLNALLTAVERRSLKWQE